MEKVRKYSYKRSVIYDVLKNTKTHPSAEWIYSQVKPKIPDISMGTVYRNLSNFKEDGTIISVGVVNGQERFDADISPHTHFICEKCDAVIDMGVLENSECINKELTDKYGVQIKSTNIVYKGFCKNCNDANINIES